MADSQVFPAFPIADVDDGVSVNAVKNCKFAMGPSVLSDFNNLFWGERREGAPSLCGHVAGVISWRAQTKMPWRTATGVVARMHDDHPRLNWPMGSNVHEPMHILDLPAHHHLSVSSSRSSCRPLHTPGVDLFDLGENAYPEFAAEATSDLSHSVLYTPSPKKAN